VTQKASCPQCGGEIIWARSKRRKRMPVDAERSTRGNILLTYRFADGEPDAEVVTKERRAQLRREHAHNYDRGVVSEPELKLHLHHRATCPHADKWRDRLRVIADEGAAA
jgi:hypothetical protein